MANLQAGWSRTMALAAAIVALAATWAANGAEKLPPWPEVEAVVAQQLATIPHYRAGDLLSKSQIAPIFTQLEALGWRVADQAAILASVLADDEFLVVQLRTPEGVKFMRKISANPQAYDELDQLARLPSGELIVKDFLRFARSDRTFSNPRGPSPAMLARLVPEQRRRGAPTQADLQKPTGRIYTAAQLVARLKRSYLAAAQ